ncbi:MAG: phosphodiester glycosidase family protein [Polyangiaceae bacterium]
MSSIAPISRDTRKDGPRAAKGPVRRALRALRVRAPYLVALVLGFAVARATFGVGIPNTPEGLAGALAAEASAYVRAEDLRWEPSAGVASDFLFGRQVLFLGRAEPGAPRDVYRARVRLSPEGHPLGIVDVHDLTNTSLGDDHALVVQGSRAAFVTAAFGQEQSVTAFDLSGEGDLDTTSKFSDRVMAAITNLQETGSRAGIGRVEITLEEPASEVGLALDGTSLHVECDATTPPRVGVYDFDKRDFSTPLRSAKPEAHRHLPKPLAHWAVDTVRAVSFIGPAPIAWLEEKVFAARDDVRRMAFKVHGSDESALADPKTADPESAVLTASNGTADDGDFPPPAIRSIFKNPAPGEGTWVVPKQTWLKRFPGAPEGTPPPFVRTMLRPDAERPYAEVLLVAMDMRQLDVDMEAGLEDPKPLTGPHGSGRIPRDPALSPRIVAAWNGGFKTEHGTYGMMLKKRVLLPPQPDAATLVVTDDGRVGIGSWAHTTDVKGIQGIAPESIVSFRQNLDPLVDHEKVNPLGRSLWGFTMPGTGVQTERSGICVTTAGHMIYAWGDDVSATTLGKAMLMAGCSYAMHLDMNPHHTGFLFAAIDDLKTRKFRSELLSTDMEIPNDRYIDFAQKDFFYAFFRDPTPKAATGVTFEKAAVTQPSPAFVPALFDARVTEGDVTVTLAYAEAGRVGVRVRPGSREPDANTGGSSTVDLAAADAGRVLFALGAGVGTSKRPRGLVTGGRVHHPWSSSMTEEKSSVALVAKADGTIAFESDPSAIDRTADAVELPLLFDTGRSFAKKTLRGDVESRTALGFTPRGALVVAKADAASYEALAQALAKVGVVRAVALDRGAHASGMFHRAGSAEAPRSRYPETVVYGVAERMKPRAFRFEPDPAFAEKKKSPK